MEKAAFASPVIDCANYFRALHEAICKAQHTIFIVGWDIDSRIELLRGEEAEQSSCPSTFFELIRWKAKQHPDLQIYLNRWNYSVFLAAERESLSQMKWKLSCPPNIHFVFDDQLPLGASHHQKIAVIDDEVAFCGGMDIAIARWDNRHHHPQDQRRVDPDGTIKMGMDKRFGPYHDVQMVVAGSAAYALAELVRERWFKATGEHPKPIRNMETKSLPPAWPPSVKPAFKQVDTGVALTQPKFHQQKLTRQIEQMYMDMIARAEHFIYMENQFFTQRRIAAALNRRLKEKPGLRVLLVSCFDPQGIMERKSMYRGRVIFRDIIEEGGVADRVVLAYPSSREYGMEEAVRIHSKLMVVDDQYLRIGSSNINNRSMTLDTECDLVVAGADEAVRKKICAIRNDLIREHTGREADDIQNIIESGASVQNFLEEVSGSRQHLRRINDEKYRHEKFARLATRFADPGKPLLPTLFTSRKRVIKKDHAMPKRLILAIFLVIALVLAWKVTPLADYAQPEKIVPLLEKVRGTAWAFPAGLAAYVLGTLIFFPHVVMTATVVIVFAPVEAFLIAMIGSLISGAIGYVAGRQLGEQSLRALVGKHSEKISGYAKKGGIVGLTLLRMLPIAPYTVVNLALGMMKVPFWTLMGATVLGMLPGTLVSVFLGKSALEVWQHPEPKNFLMLGAGLAVWIGIIALTHLAAKRWHKPAA